MIQNRHDLNRAVLAVMEQTPDARRREIMMSLVTHLHGFVNDVKLTEDEFRTATVLVARMGQMTDDTHNEVVLMAGSMGVSNLVCLLTVKSAILPCMLCHAQNGPDSLKRGKCAMKTAPKHENLMRI